MRTARLPEPAAGPAPAISSAAPRLLPWLAVAAVVLAIVVLALPSRVARAEYADGEPGISRQGLEYLYRLGARPAEYGEEFHFGAYLGYSSRVFFRDWLLSPEALNIMGGIHMQWQGMRMELQSQWAQFFDTLDPFGPTMWDVSISYQVQIEVATVQFGLKHFDFGGVSSDITVYESDPFPARATEMFLKAVIFPDKLQGEQSVNLLYTAELHQRLDEFDGFLVSIGILTISQNAWVIGDVLQFYAQIWFSYRYLRRGEGDFSSYRVGAKILKDISSFEQPGMGPWFLELGVFYTGELAAFATGDVQFLVLIHFIA